MCRVKLLFLILPLFVISSGCSSPSHLTRKEKKLVNKKIKTGKPKDTVYIKLDHPPKIVGGLAALEENVVYPKEAIRHNIEGKVILLCTITKDGHVKNPRIIEGLGYGCNEAAIQALLKTTFIPGEYKHKPVDTEYTIPVVFKLR